MDKDICISHQLPLVVNGIKGEQLSHLSGKCEDAIGSLFCQLSHLADKCEDLILDCLSCGVHQISHLAGKCEDLIHLLSGSQT